MEIRKKNTKNHKIKKVPAFCHKIKTKALKENLRHSSLDENAVYTHKLVYASEILSEIFVFKK